MCDHVTFPDKVTNERLERLQSSVDQLQGAVEQLQEDGCNAMTGSFHNPAHNCSHITQYGSTVYIGIAMVYPY